MIKISLLETQTTWRIQLALTEMTVSDRENFIQQPEIDAARATARLPCLDIEIIHRRSLGGDAEQISINLQARGSCREFVAGSEQVSFLLHPTRPGRPSVVPMEASIPCKALTQNAKVPLGTEVGGDPGPPPPSIVRPGSLIGRKPSGQRRRRRQTRGCDTRRLSFRMRAGTACSLFPLPDVVGDEFG
jgi:hypothetical protein